MCIGMRAELLLSACVAALAAPTNKFGIGVYNDTAAPLLVDQLPLAQELVGDGGRVLLYLNLRFRSNGDASSCLDDCSPKPWEIAAVQQAYALGLRPVVRLGQWPRTIRDFADDDGRRGFTGLAQAYVRFASKLPLPPGYAGLEVQLLNEPNVCGEWQCSGSGVLDAGDAAAEAASCLRDLAAAIRALPRLRLSLAPIAYIGFPHCGCGPEGKRPAQNASDLGFLQDMLAAVPSLFDGADFFSAHPYPFHQQPFTTAQGRAGSVNYRTQLAAIGRDGDLPVLITETGWFGPDEAMKASSIVAGFQEEWLTDPRVEGVMPFIFALQPASPFFSKGPWVQWPEGEEPLRQPQFVATRRLRCDLGVGGNCTTDMYQYI